MMITDELIGYWMIAAAITAVAAIALGYLWYKMGAVKRTQGGAEIDFTTLNGPCGVAPLWDK